MTEDPSAGTSDTVGPIDAVKRLRWCAEAFERLGCTVSSSSRLSSAISRLQRCETDRALLLDARWRILAAEAHRMSWELMVIAMRALRADRETTAFPRWKLQEILAGQEAPDVGNQHARNTQFELYAPALFAEAGYDIKAGVADAQWDFYGESLRLEAKRLNTRSERTLEERLREAARKIAGPSRSPLLETAESRGLIVVNVDLHFGDFSVAGHAVPPDAAFRERFRVVELAGRRVLDRYSIIGILAFGYAFQWHLTEGGRPHLRMFYPTLWWSLSGGDPAERQMARRMGVVGKRVTEVASELATRLPSWR